MWRKGNCFAWVVGMQTGAATVESSMKIPQKIRNGTALWPSNSTSGNLSEETQNTNLKDYKHPYVHYNNCQDLEAAQMPISRWVDKTTMGHVHNEILIGHNKEEKFTLCDSMDGSGVHYAKWNKPVKERQTPCDSIHIWNLMNEWKQQAK